MSKAISLVLIASVIVLAVSPAIYAGAALA